MRLACLCFALNCIAPSVAWQAHVNKKSKDDDPAHDRMKVAFVMSSMQEPDPFQEQAALDPDLLRCIDLARELSLEEVRSTLSPSAHRFPLHYA